MPKTPTSEPEKKAPRSILKRIGFSVLAVTLLLIFLEGLLSAVWVGLDVGLLLSDGPRVEELKEEFHCQYDEELGWANKPGTRVKNFYGPGQTITINANGVRGLVDYSKDKPDETFRAICLGDSFTLGYGVDDRMTFPHQLQELGSGRLETVNMGQGGYSIGQSYLWLKRLGPELKPDLVVCVFIVEDFRRLMTGRTANGFATPKFDVENERLVVGNVPVPAKLGKGALILKQGEIVNAMRENSALVRTIAQVAPAPAAPTDEEALFIGVHISRATAALCREFDCPTVFALTPTLPELCDSASVTRYDGVSRLLEQFLNQEANSVRRSPPGVYGRGESGLTAVSQRGVSPLHRGRKCHRQCHRRDGVGQVAQASRPEVPVKMLPLIGAANESDGFDECPCRVNEFV
ncbi:MAG: SGNH/GDSL hydrolase family protein [Planctomycetota bacterium]|nr:SGNH/GDSL hydrolase family protein [Planctomycetota bacterium]MDA1248363.1 SGNH/GDSL hydrolase family protein [Planctomycetota bacterium]